MLQGKQHTRVLFDGRWVEVPKNVGQEIRDRYGPEVYKHAQHPSALSRTGYTAQKGYSEAGHFTKCRTPGRHDCLDQYPADGNLAFEHVNIP